MREASAAGRIGDRVVHLGEGALGPASLDEVIVALANRTHDQHRAVASWNDLVEEIQPARLGCVHLTDALDPQQTALRIDRGREPELPESARRCLLVSDDRHPDDLMDQGHIDHSIRLAVGHGLNPVTAIQMATLNPAERFRLWDRGAVAPGYRADLVVLEDLEHLRVDRVFSAGRLVAEQGEMLETTPAPTVAARGSVNIDWKKVDLAIPARGDRARVIGVVPGQIVTEARELPVRQENGLAVADVSEDVLKLAVIERHHASGNVSGWDSCRASVFSEVRWPARWRTTPTISSSPARTTPTCSLPLARWRRWAADWPPSSTGQVVGRVSLSVAGLMSEMPLETVRQEMDALLAAARDLGTSLPNPFMSLSFLALPVIPKLKLTDQGLVDVDAFDFVPLFVGGS